MSRLEAGYRTLLRVLPKWYRHGHEAGMVAAFLADADDVVLQTRWPGWSELWRILVLAVRLRVGGAGSPARPLAWGQAVRLVATLGLLAHSISFPFAILGTAWASVSGAGLEPSAAIDVNLLRGLMSPALTILAFLALILGHRRPAIVLALLATAANLYAVWQSASGIAVVLSGLPLWIPLLCLFLGFRRDWVPVSQPGWWLIALPLGALLAMGVTLVGRSALFDPTSLYCLGLVVAALCLVRFRRGGPAWPLALSMLSVLVLFIRAVTLTQLTTMPTVPLVSSYVQLVALLATAVTLAVLARRALRQLPEPSTEHTPQ